MPARNDGHDNADSLLGVVNDAARAVGARFVTFLTVGVYISVIVASTTDEMLVHAKPVILPLLNAPIPVRGPFGFYTLAPWLIVFLHWDVLLQLSTLRDKVALFRSEAERLPDRGASLYQRVASLYYLQFFLGQGSAALQILSTLIIWLSVIVLPLVLLLVTQVRFLSFHGEWYSFLQRAAVAVDVALILVLWPRLSAGDAETLSRAAPWRAWVRRFLLPTTWLLGVSAVTFCFVVARIPGEWPEAWVTARLEAWLPEEWSRMWFEVRNLSLQGEDLTNDHLSALTINRLGDGGDTDEREKELVNVSERNFLQGRDLRHANMYHGVLPKLDLRSQRVDGTLILTRLSDADLRFAEMEGVLLDEADLQRANLEQAHVEGGSLLSTQLQDAKLSGAHVSDAKLRRAILQCADLSNAELQGSDLRGAFLEGAVLSNAHLQGALLHGADLRGADLSHADLRGTDLSEAHLEGASLEGVRLQGAVLTGAFVGGAKLETATLDSAPSDQLRFDPDSRFDAVCRGICDAGRTAEVMAAVTCVANEGTARAVQAQADHWLDIGNEAYPSDEQLFAAHADGRTDRSRGTGRRASGSSGHKFDCSLLDVACADPYAARGLCRQALDSENPNRPGLATVLRDGVSRKECPGLRHLPDDLRTGLAEAPSLQADGTSPSGCDDSAGAETRMALAAPPPTDSSEPR